MKLPYSNLRMSHMNEGASKPLILPIHVVCNTDDDALFANIRENSRKYNKWLKQIPAHDGVAVLVGSGPSLSDALPEITRLQAAGGTIFAMNGAAKYLSDNGIYPDYQVMIDARAETAQLVGPAKQHLFASQVHPDSFAKAEDIILWHLQITDIDDYLPEHDDGYCLIGGAASVGNTATCLTYAMGFRDLQIFGYDSSFRDGTNHAFRQEMNDGEPCAHVKFNGKEYVCSLTMKLQAEKFMSTSRDLRQLGCKITVHGSGILPDMYNSVRENLTEKEKYERMWAISEYRTCAPGEECAQNFLDILKPSGRVIDYGAGTGRGALKIRDYGCDVLLVDFAENCRDDSAKDLPFLMHDLTEKLPPTYFSKYGFCTDMLEHIKTSDVDAVISNIMDASEVVFFQISTVPDMAGAIINQDLHLTVQNHAWWNVRFKNLGFVVMHDEEGIIASVFIVKKLGGYHGDTSSYTSTD